MNRPLPTVHSNDTADRPAPQPPSPPAPQARRNAQPPVSAGHRGPARRRHRSGSRLPRQLRFVSGGFVGVDVFFVLSGYLIIRLLLAEYAATGRISLLTFYARRARRLLPAMAAMLLVTLAASAALYSPLEHLRFSETALATAAYASNLLFAHRAADYWSTTSSLDPLLHTWSLSVEEQFYLVWPLLFFALLKAPRKLALWATLVGSLLSLLLSLHLTIRFQPYAFFLPTSRAWEFGAGALLALVGGRVGRSVAINPTLLLALGLAAIFGSSLAFDDGTPFPGLAALLPVAGTILCLQVGEHTGEPTPLHRGSCTPQ